VTSVENIFVKYIREGRIRSVDELKSYYRQIVMKTHPDIVGSDRLVEQYIEYGKQYSEARAMMQTEANYPDTAAEEHSVSYRLLFYREFYHLERIDRPYAFNKHYHSEEEIELAKRRVHEYFSEWRGECIDLHTQAQEMYDRIKKQKPRGPYRKHALFYNLSPVFHNILSYQLTGSPYYRKQLAQNFDAVIYELERGGFDRLIEYIHFLMADMHFGPAIMEWG
jgi:hypothetical protein